jgi:ATP-binding cassette subfamily F protein 3
VAQVEKELAELTEERDAIQAELADPAIYAAAGERVASLTRRRKQLDQEIAAYEEQWLTAQAALERET